MAKQIVTLLIDDIDGSEANRIIEFGLDGVTYTIDLSDKNVGKLRMALDPYLAVASRVGPQRRQRTDHFPQRRRSAEPHKPRTNQAIREWAGENGYEVSERGGIPSSIVEAFHSKR